MKSTHTYALLEVSAEAYREIELLLLDAGYSHVIEDGKIDMHGIALCTQKIEPDVNITVQMKRV